MRAYTAVLCPCESARCLNRHKTRLHTARSGTPFHKVPRERFRLVDRGMHLPRFVCPPPADAHSTPPGGSTASLHLNLRAERALIADDVVLMHRRRIVDIAEVTAFLNHPKTPEARPSFFR